MSLFLKKYFVFSLNSLISYEILDSYKLLYLIVNFCYFGLNNLKNFLFVDYE